MKFKNMKEKLYPIKITELMSYDYPSWQRVEWDYDDFKGSYSVHDLCECPEDAIIGRDLFSADDFLKAIQFGIELGYKGYTNFDITREKREYLDE